MHLERQLAAGLASAAWLTGSFVHAQPAGPVDPPETLETPYEDGPPTAAPGPPPHGVAAPPPPAAVAAPPAPARPLVLSAPQQADTRPLGPIRARRKLALTGELGFNGLAGFGPILTYHVHPRVSLDLGAGLSMLGWKVGVRGRYNFMTTPFTPFLGAGLNATTGLGEVTLDPSEDPNGDPNRGPVTLDLKDSYLVQGVIGFDFIHRRGFTMLGCIGYAGLLNEDNVEVTGVLTDDEKEAVDFFFKSGAVISVAMGYAFE